MTRFAKPWDHQVRITDLIDETNDLTMAQRCQLLRDRAVPVLAAITAKDEDAGTELEECLWEFESLQDDCEAQARGENGEGMHQPHEHQQAFNYALAALYDFGDEGKRIWLEGFKS